MGKFNKWTGGQEITKHRPSVVLLPVHSLQRWLNIKQTLVQCLIFTRCPLAVFIDWNAVRQNDGQSNTRYNRRGFLFKARPNVLQVHCIDACPDLSVDVTVRSGVKKTPGTAWMLASTSDGGGRNRPTR